MIKCEGGGPAHSTETSRDHSPPMAAGGSFRRIVRGQGGRKRVSARPAAGPLVVPALSIALIMLLPGSWLLAKHLVTGAPPLVVAAGRTAACFLVVTAIAMLSARSRSEIPVAASRWGSIALLGFLGFFAYIAGTMVATRMIGASRVGLITSLLPSITFVIGTVAFCEPATRRKVLGTSLAVLGACGYAMADTQTVYAGQAELGGAVLLGGALIAFGGTAANAVYGYVYARRMADLTVIGVLPAVTGAGTVMLGLIVIFFVPVAGVSWIDWVGIAGLGALFTAPVFLIIHELLLRKGPLYPAVLTIAVPFLVRLGEWVLGWRGAPQLPVLLTLIVCACGVWLTIGGPRSAKRVVASLHGE